MSDNNGYGRGRVVTWTALVTGVTIAVTVVGGSWSILQWLYTENNQLRAEITAVRVENAQNQVTKQELRNVVGEVSVRIEKRLDRLEEKIMLGRTAQ